MPVSFAGELETSSTPVPRGGTITLSAIAHYAEYLKMCYRVMSTHQKYKWLPNVSKTCINLVTVKEKNGVQKKAAIRLEDVLKPNSRGDMKCVLAEGEHGVGKSLMCIELCKSWDKVFESYSLVILLRLQEKKVQEAKYLSNLFYHPDLSLQQAVTRQVLQNDGAGTLLIIDGIDQLPPLVSKNHPLIRILQGSCLQKSTVLLTSSSMTADVLTECKVKIDRRIQLIGFTQEEIEQHAETSFGSNMALADSFSIYLSSNPAIRSTMHIPFNTASITEAYKRSKLSGTTPPKTMSQVYKKIIQLLLKHYMLVKGVGDQSFPERFEDLPAKIYQQLRSLAQLAFTGLLKQQVVFHKLPHNCNHFCFMNASSELYTKKGGSTSYSFLHLGLQEYFAAFHISTLPPSEQIDVFREYSGLSHLDGMWKFLAGITCFESSMWDAVKAELCTEGTLNTFVLRCMYEAHEQVSCESVLGSSTVVFPQAHYGEEVLPVDCFALGCCLAHSKCTLTLRIRLDTEMLRMLTLGLKSSPKVSSMIDTLFLRPPITQTTAAILNNLPPKVIEGLDLSHCKLGKAELNSISVVIANMVNLKHLDIRGNPVGEEGLVQLLRELSKCSNLQSLSMINTGVGSRDIEALAVLIAPSYSLRELKVGDEEMPPECVSLLVNTVFAQSSLHSLHLWFTDLRPSMGTLSELLRLNSNVSKLEMHACKIGSEGSKGLAEAIKVNTSVKTLVLSMFDVPSSLQIGAEGAIALAEMLKINQNLEHLELPFDKSLGRQDALAIIGALQHNHTLKCLKVPQHHFTAVDLAYAALDSRVK